MTASRAGGQKEDVAQGEIEVVRTSRDDEAIRQELERYLAGQLGADAAPRVSAISSPSASGMSSETLLFEASWREPGGGEGGGAFVGRMAPSAGDYPTFPTYDMGMQARVMQLADAAGVPVPKVHWLEEDPGFLGAPFFVMERLQGRVPADVPPYLAAGWVFDATTDQRRRLQDATVAAIARIHSIDLERNDGTFLEFDAPGETPLQRHVAHQRTYYEWVVGRIARRWSSAPSSGSSRAGPPRPRAS